MGYKIKSVAANSGALARTSQSTVWPQEVCVYFRSPELELDVSWIDLSGETDWSTTLSLKSWQDLGRLKIRGVDTTWFQWQLPILTFWDQIWANTYLWGKAPPNSIFKQNNEKIGHWVKQNKTNLLSALKSHSQGHLQTLCICLCTNR